MRLDARGSAKLRCRRESGRKDGSATGCRGTLPGGECSFRRRWFPRVQAYGGGRLAARMPRALITGIAGQDGSYLAEFLLSKGYEVCGIVRGSPHAAYE